MATRTLSIVLAALLVAAAPGALAQQPPSATPASPQPPGSFSQPGTMYQPGLPSQPGTVPGTPMQPGTLYQPGVTPGTPTQPGTLYQPGVGPGVSDQTGRGTLQPYSGTGDQTGRLGQPGCTPPNAVTGRGGEVCQPARTLPPPGATELPTGRPSALGPTRPTGPLPGQYPQVFPPYGAETGSPPAPYGPGNGGRLPY